MSPPEEPNISTIASKERSPQQSDAAGKMSTTNDPSNEEAVADSNKSTSNSPVQTHPGTLEQSSSAVEDPELTASKPADSGSEEKGKAVNNDPFAAGDSADMTASTTTLKPSEQQTSKQAHPQFLSPETANASYIDPTPPTPTASQPPSRSPSTAARSHTEHSPTRLSAEHDRDGKKDVSEDEQEGGSRLEIQSIMDQFDEFGGGPGEEEVMSPRLEIASPMLGSPIQHPPRKSSLEPLSASASNQIPELQKLQIGSSDSVGSGNHVSGEQAPPVPPKDGTFGTPSRTRDERASSLESPSIASRSMHRPPPPEPEPEPDLPFDFHRFLEQLRNKKADPVARYLKSFLSEFGKKQWMVHEQVKIISDFLAFIANKMQQCEVWRDVSDAEFDNAREGMEKLVMNRLYSQTFSPAIPSPKPVPGAKSKRKGGDALLGPGRRGQHQEDVERDDIVTQKINIYGWVKEEHLDMPVIEESGKRFLRLAQQELLKIKSYRAPRDKIICVLNCCKVIFGLLKHNKSDGSADSFIPHLIYVVLQSNPEHLVSNVQYILRFRNQDKLGGEAGYYLSSLMGAVQFIEGLDRTTLTITDEEFEQNVEAAVSAIAEKHQAMSPTIPQQPAFNEKESTQAPELPQRPGMDSGGEASAPRRSLSNDPSPDDGGAPMSGLLKTIQKPLSSIGRIFSEEGGALTAIAGSSADSRPQSSRGEDAQRPPSRHTLSAEEAAARQASAETAEAQRLQRAEHANVVETLKGMFPDLDKDIISDVVYQKEGRVGLAVDACLALST